MHPDNDIATTSVTEAESQRVATWVAPVKSGPRTSLAINVAWRAVANWSSQLISWAALLIVVRLLKPSDFGIVGMCVVLYAHLRFVGEFGIPTTVVTLRSLSDDDLAQLNTMGGVFGIGAFIMACLLAWPAAVFFRTPRLVPVILVTCIGLIAQGLRSVPEGLLAKEMRFKLLSFVDAGRDVTSAVVTVTLAYLHFGYWALVWGTVVSTVLRSATIIAIRPYRFALPRPSSVRRTLVFSGHVWISVFAWSTYNSLDNVTAGRVLGQSALGLYGMAWTLANTPLEKVVSLVTTVVPSYLAAVQKEPAALRRYLLNVTEAIALITFPLTVGLALVARQAVPLIMGTKWNGMILPLEILCSYAAFRSIVALLPKLLTAIGNARFVMRVELWNLVWMGTAFYVGSRWGTAGIAFAWVIAYPVAVIPLFWKAFASIKLRVPDYLQAVRPGLDGTIAMALVVGLLKWKVHFGHPLVLHLVIEILCGGLAYIATVLLLHRERALSFLRLVKNMRQRKLQAKLA